MAKHLTDDMKKLGHHKESGEHGGKCLWEHGSNVPFTENNSCSYRWQAHLRARDNKAIYHSYRSARIAGDIDILRTRKDKKTGWITGFVIRLAKPNPGDWDVDGPLVNGVEQHLNFRKSRVPYWNQAHHLIPKGEFIRELDAQCGSVVSTWVKRSLLASTYNINARVNMMHLPMDREVARILRLPRHIDLRYGDGATQEIMDHSLYNAHVAKQLTAIIADFKQAYQTAKTKHPDPPPEKLSKAKLERLSQKLFAMIVASRGANAAGGGAGVSLNSMVP